MNTTRCPDYAYGSLGGSTDRLEEKLRDARADKQHAEGQEVAGQHVLTRTINEKNKLHDANIKQDKELKDLRAQLSDAFKENKKFKCGIFSMLCNLLVKNGLLLEILTSLLL